MNTTQPMPSARMCAGRYVVLGTSRQVEAVRRGREWYLEVDGTEEVGPFPTKRAALQHAQEDVTL